MMACKTGSSGNRKQILEICMIGVNEECAWFFTGQDWFLKFRIVTFDHKLVKTNSASRTSTIARGCHITICVYHSVNVVVLMFLDRVWNWSGPPTYPARTGPGF